MNYKNTIIKLLGVAFLAGAVMNSCYNYDDVPLVRLAAFENEITMEAAGGSFELKFFANSSYHIEYLNGADWLTLTTDDAVDEVALLTGTCARNEGFKRRADFVLCSDLSPRRDTVVVKQKAYNDAFLEFNDAMVVLPGSGGTTTAIIHTNIDFNEMTTEIMYNDVNNADWIADFYITDSDSEDRELRVTTLPNTDEIAPRTASVSLSFIDGWGENIIVSFVLIQCNAKEEVASEITFEEFRNDYSDGGIIYDYVQISGIVVSSKANGNAGEPEQSSTSSIDFSPTGKTVYLESEDGRYGISVQTVTEDDNIFDQFDHATILLHGTTGTVAEENPDAPPCYQIVGIDRSMIFSRTPGTINDVPVKERTIGSLTDDDIYTYVKLKDVELPIRKGPLYPVESNLSDATNHQGVTKLPLLVRDIEGNVIYMMTNDRCLYKRDGTRLPYGSGNLYGVVVHEHFSRYEWRNGADPADINNDETLANIGRYQLRHQSKEDIWGDMNDDFEDGFSALLCEYRYVVINNKTVVPSYGTNGWLDHTYQTKYTGTSDKNYANSNGTHFSGGSRTYDYLGPCGNTASSLDGENYGNRNGIGVVIDPSHEDYETYEPNRFAYNDDGKIELACQYAENTYCGYGSAGWSESNSTNASYLVPNGPQSSDGTNNGKGFVNAGVHHTFVNSYWWDDDTGRPYSYLLNVSTAGITSDVVSMQFCVRPNGASFTPRYWCAEWSLTDSQDDDSKWTLIGDFTIPDQPESTSKSTLWALPALKQVNFTLPQDILGYSNVYIRIHPTSDVCSSGQGGDYTDTVISEWETMLSTRPNMCLSYLAIRYNK